MCLEEHFCFLYSDICRAVPKAKVKLYADDTNVFLFDKDDRKLNSETSLCLQELTTWFKTNKLTLNLDETCHMFFFQFAPYNEQQLFVMHRLRRRRRRIQCL